MCDPPDSDDSNDLDFEPYPPWVCSTQEVSATVALILIAFASLGAIYWFVSWVASNSLHL